MSSTRDVIRAAGGVVTRRSTSPNATRPNATRPNATEGALEFLVVHRPRYDDWSLPKGKLEPGESFEDAARREIEEETGLRVELGAPLPASEYVDRHGRPKVVHYWLMTPVGQATWEPNDEVDETRWITSAQAATLLSYEHDRRLVATVADTSPPGGSS